VLLARFVIASNLAPPAPKNGLICTIVSTLFKCRNCSLARPTAFANEAFLLMS